MAEYDGSIRIGVLVDADNAEKQLENLKVRMSSETKEIEKQENAVSKLKAQFESLSSKSVKLAGAEKMWQELQRAQHEAAVLNEEFERLNHLAGNDLEAIPAETAERIREVSDALGVADAKAERIAADLSSMNIPLDEIDKSRTLAASLAKAEYGLYDLQSCVAQTNIEIADTQETLDKFTEEMRSMKENAEVADQSIINLNERISKLKQYIAGLEKMGIGFGYKIRDDAEAELSSLESQKRNYVKSVKEAHQSEQENELGGSSGKLRSFGEKISEVSALLKSLFVKSVGNASRHTKTLHDRVRKLGRNRGFYKAGKSANKLLDRLKHIGERILRIASSAFIFNVLSRGFSELTKQVGSYLMVDKKFAESLVRIKGNLLTAFQPIYDTIMPALNSLMSILQEASAVLAKFMAQLFGKTPKQAQENAEALHEQAKAAEEVAEETEEAKKSLASFDTIEILGQKEDDSNKNEKEEAKFDQEFEDVEVPSWLEKLGDILKEIMGWLKDFFKPLKDAWDKYGAPLIDALKRAFSSIWDLIKAIAKTFLDIWNSPLGQKTLELLFKLLTEILGIIADIADTFRKVWESGWGEKTLTNLFTLLNTILQIILDIAIAFRAAWSKYGEYVVEALFFALNAILELLISVGQAFDDAWNDNGRGQKIFETILHIIGDIFNIVGELANRLKEAWEANGNGKAIWAAILDSVQAVLDFIHKVTEATLEWAKNLDLEPLVSAFRSVMESLPPLLETIGQALYEIYTEIVLPFFSKLLEEWIPWLLEKLAALFTWLSEHKTVMKALIEVVLAFIAAWKVFTVIQAIGSIINSLDPMKIIIAAILTLIILIIANFEKIKEVVEKVVGGIVQFFKDAAQAVQDFWDSLFGGQPSGRGGGSFAGGFGGSSISYSANRPSGISVERFAAFNEAYNAASGLENIPHLAKGAVISPNHEFLAVLGDQKAGKNVEAPLSTIEQALENVLSRRSDGGGANVEIKFTGSLSQLARVLQPEITVAQQRHGPSLVTI